MPYFPKLKSAGRCWALAFLLATLVHPRALAGAPTAASSAFNHGRWIFSGQKTASQKRPALYRQKGLAGRAELLLDPNASATPAKYLPEDCDLSTDGRHLCFVVAQVDAPFEEIHVMEVATRRILGDALKWTVFSDIAWRGDGFYYAKYPGPLPKSSAQPANQGVYYHRLGTPQSKDTLVYANAAHPGFFYRFLNTFNERFLFLHITDPVAGNDRETFLYRDDRRHEKQFVTLGKPFAAGRYFLCDQVRNQFMIFTTYGAPRGRVVMIDPAHPEEEKWQSIVAESADTLESADTAGGKLFLTYALQNRVSRVAVCGLDGHPQNELPLRIWGKVEVQWGRPEDAFVFFTVTPPGGVKTVFVYEIKSKQVKPFAPARQ